jgi:hypothetical protein
MNFGNRTDESLLHYCESIRQEVEADRKAASLGSRHFFAAGDSVKKYATDLRDEMTRRRLTFTPIEWWQDRYR